MTAGLSTIDTTVSRDFIPRTTEMHEMRSDWQKLGLTRLGVRRDIRNQTSPLRDSSDLDSSSSLHERSASSFCNDPSIRPPDPPEIQQKVWNLFWKTCRNVSLPSPD